MDKENTQAVSPDCIITVDLPPLEATVCSVKDKTTKKARRKANKDQADANWKVCVPNCFHDGNNNKSVQRHMCQSWIHPECVGQSDSDIVGIWTCPIWCILPVLVQQLLDRSSVLEAMMARLEESNRQLVAHVGEQRHEMSGLRDGIKTANASTYAEFVRAPRNAAGWQQHCARHRRGANSRRRVNESSQQGANSAPHHDSQCWSCHGRQHATVERSRPSAVGPSERRHSRHVPLDERQIRWPRRQLYFSQWHGWRSCIQQWWSAPIARWGWQTVFEFRSAKRKAKKTQKQSNTRRDTPMVATREITDSD